MDNRQGDVDLRFAPQLAL